MTARVVRSLTFLTFTLLLTSAAIAQSGKNFWVAFPQNAKFEIGVLRQMIAVTALEDADVAITRPADAPSTVFSMSKQLKKGETHVFDLDTSVQCIKSEVVETKGIHVGSTGNILVTAYSMRKASTDSYRVMPLTELGREYIVVGYSQPPTDRSFTTEFTIVASEPNTLITIFPSTDTRMGHPKGETLEVVLHRGQTYNVKGVFMKDNSGDLTGTRITSDKPIALFTGHTCAQVPKEYIYCDVLIEQAAPNSKAGHDFILPALQRKTSYAVRVVALQDNTSFICSSEKHVLMAGEFADLTRIEGDQLLRADKPVIVAQYGTSNEADANKIGDPFMMLVPPVSAFTSQVTVPTPPIRGNWHHFVSVVCDQAAATSLTVNGAAIGDDKLRKTNDSYFVMELELRDGIHDISSDGKIGVFSYGLGAGVTDNYDSYGTYCGPW